VKSIERKAIAYYITPHGFGHAVRALEIIRCLLELRNDLEIVIVSDIPDFLIEQNVGRLLPQRRRRLDVGLVQMDSLRFDLDASRNALNSLHYNHQALVDDEIRFLKSQHAGVVVSDISFLALEASSQCGIPNVGISNFTWDWIYDYYARSDPRWRPLVSWIRDCYRKCDLFLQLPMHGDCSACPRILDVPLVTRKAKRKPEEVRRVLDLDSSRKTYLIAFAALELDEDAQRRIEKLDHALFFYKQPLKFQLSNARSLDGVDLSYAEVVSVMDAVITKPGYGIAADCLAHGAPMIYTDRGPFPEYDILVEEMTRHLTTVFIPSEDLYAGHWESAVRNIESLPRRSPTLRDDGAEICARSILKQAGWE
jgi:L-arabinokinase